MAARFRLIFRGQVAAGSDPDTAARALAARFSLDPAKTRQVMSGRKVALASDMEETAAFTLQAELESHGIITRIERDPHALAPAAAPEPPPTAPPEPPAPASASALEMLPTPETGHAPPGDAFAEAGFSRAAHSCVRCQHTLAPDSSFCIWCGARQKRGLPPWLVVPAFAVLLGVLAAIPLHQTIETRQGTAEQVAHGMQRADEVKASVRTFIERTNFWPNSNLDAGLPQPQALGDEVVSRITVGNQALISVTFSESLAKIGGHTLMFVPASDSGTVPEWECRGGTLPAAWVPEGCTPPEGPASKQPTPSKMPDRPLGNAGNATQELPPANYLRRVLTQELEQTRYIRDQMRAFQRRNGRWPETHEELQLEDPYRLGSYAMRRVEVASAGHLVYEFSTALEGMEGQTLTLQALEGGRGWRCESLLPASHLPIMCQQ